MTPKKTHPHKQRWLKGLGKSLSLSLYFLQELSAEFLQPGSIRLHDSKVEICTTKDRNGGLRVDIADSNICNACSVDKTEVLCAQMVRMVAYEY